MFGAVRVVHGDGDDEREVRWKRATRSAWTRWLLNREQQSRGPSGTRRTLADQAT